MNTKSPAICSPALTRLLDHMHRARLGRNALAQRNLTVTELAERTGLSYGTVLRFLGLDGERNTKDPRTSTTFKILHQLGWKLVQ